MLHGWITAAAAAIFVGVVPLLSAAAPLTEAMRKEDQRLQKPVTVRGRHMFVGELLESLSATTGVHLETGDPEDGGADELLTVDLRGTTLADVMEALWSLVSYKGASWHWSRQGGGAPYSYRLTRPPQARQLATRLLADQQRRLESQTAILIEAAGLADSERAGLADRLAQSLGLSDSTTARACLQGGRAMAGMRAFAACVSPEQRLAVLRGEGEARVAVADMADDDKRFVQSVYDESRAMVKHDDGSLAPVPFPASIRFHTRSTAADGTPCLVITLDGLGGYAYSGATPLANGMAQTLSSEWIQEGDARTDHAEARPAPHPLLAARTQPSPEDRVLSLAEESGVPLLMRCPVPWHVDPGDLLGETLGTGLERLVGDRTTYMHKWRKGVLLVEYAGWYRRPEPNLRWSVVRRLRQAATAHDGSLGIEDLGFAAAKTTPDQVKSYEHVLPGSTTIAEFHGILCASARRLGGVSQLASAAGVEIDDTIGAALDRFLRPVPDGPSPTGRSGGRRVRIRRNPLQGSQSGGFALDLQILNADGEWQGVVGIAAPRWRPDAEGVTERASGGASGMGR